MHPPLRQVFLTVVVTTILGASTARADNVALPDLGDESTALITPSQERRLGADFMRQARKTLKLVDDPEVNNYIQTLGQRLVSHTDTPQQPFHFFVVDDPTINAFAVPGGYVGVHTGLILNTQSESELASVLAHEISHVTQRHIPRMMVEQQHATLPAMAAILASILVASTGHSAGEAGIALTSAAMAQREINFTRSFEEEADRIGEGLLARSGFDPRAMPKFFERMQAANRYNETNLPEFLRTHPVTTSRIADARNRAEQYPVHNVPDSLDYKLVRARLSAFEADDPAEIARGFQSKIAQGKADDRVAERYGYALALMRAQNIAAARTEIAKLVALQPDRSAFRIAQAQIEAAGGNFDEALNIYAAAYKKSPGWSPLARNYAATLLETGHAREAKAILAPIVREQSDDPGLYKMMASAAGDTGDKVEAHRSMAEYYYLNGNLTAALEQLQIATRFAGDNFYLQSSLDARIQAVKDEIKLAQQK
jgi:predicted Zn-dependent protease